jgi:hypothetical protein
MLGPRYSIRVVSNFANTIPDMKFAKGSACRGRSGDCSRRGHRHPSGELFGAPHSRSSFRIMAVDIQTILDGKIAKTYHIENWLSAIGQLRAK